MKGADAAFDGFLEACIAAGDKCALSTLNNTASDLADTLKRTAESYRTDPVAVGSNVFTYTAIKTLYYVIIKSLVGDLSTMTTLLYFVVMRENLDAVAEFAEAVYASASGNEALPGISCADAIPRSADRAGVMDEVEYMLETSREFGAILPAYAMSCAQWPFEAKERHPVDKKVMTPNPVLFIGNTYDAATWVGSAYGMSKLFPGSVVVEQKGFGVSLLRPDGEPLAGNTNVVVLMLTCPSY